MTQIVYHFCPRHLLPGITREGLRLGRIPSRDARGIILIPGFQWVTTNPSFAQSWTDQPGSRLPYSRTEVRLTLRIPKLRQQRLLRWQEHGRKLSAMYDDLSSYGDPENWLVYRGVMPASWIVDVTHRSSEVAA